MTTPAAPAEIFGLLRFHARSAKTAVGVEAGDDWIRVASRRGRSGDEAWSFAALGPDGEGSDGGGGRSAVRRARDEARRRGVPRGPAVCAISSAAVDIFPLTLRPTDAEPLDAQVVRHARDHLGERIEGAVLDYAVPPEEVWRPGDDAVPALVFAARRDLVDGLLDRLERIGLRADRVVTPACALAPHVDGAASGVRHLLIATGEEATSVSVVENGHVLLERMLPWGFRSLVERLRGELELDDAQSRLLLTAGPGPIAGQDDDEEDAGPDGAMKGALRQVLEPEYQELAQEASGCLGYANSFFRPAGTAAAILTGPLAESAPLRLFLEEGLGMPVLGPSEGLRLPGFRGSGTAAAFATAAGCALWPGENGR
ncbi:MAG: hypothetical protein JW958_10560 [Candidatus Eisenbacteria bacterium]|nr:hypothetical protein [Candidatus Eisenbacteria bacterium]